MYLALGLAVAASVAFALGIGWLMRRRRFLVAIGEDNDRAGVKIAAAFGVYGIVLGFAVVSAQQSYMDAEYSLRQETGALLSVVHLARSAPPEYGGPILESTWTYLRTEIDDWTSLGTPQSHAGSWQTMQAVYDDVKIMSEDPAQATLQSALFASLLQAEAGRADRILVAHSGVSTLMWVLLVGGGVLVLAMSALLNFESNRFRLLLLTGMALLISVSLLTIWALSHPFGGAIPIDPGPLEQVVDLL